MGRLSPSYPVREWGFGGGGCGGWGGGGALHLPCPEGIFYQLGCGKGVGGGVGGGETPPPKVADV